MPQRTQDEWPEKADDQGLGTIYETLKIRPVGYEFTIKKGAAIFGNCILRVAQHSSEINGGYCGGNDRRARSILLPRLELQDHLHYV